MLVLPMLLVETIHNIGGRDTTCKYAALVGWCWQGREKYTEKNMLQWHFHNHHPAWYSKIIHSFSILSDDGPKPPLKRFLHIVRSRASSFNWQYPLLSLRSSSSFLRLHPRLLVTSISPFIFPSITCCRRQFLRKMWPIQLGYSSAHWL